MKYLLIAVSIFVFAGTTCADSYITQEQVKGMLNNWLTAQNTGSYQNYADLYAGKFYGIRRSGTHTYKFNHDSWLKDRGKMFKKKMTVEMSDPEIQLLGRSASVKFSQSWKSETYSDTGDKLLLVTLENGKPKIAREEMLSSEVLVNKKEDLSSSSFPFAFVIKEGIVIPRPAVDPASIKIKPKLIGKEPDYSASVPVGAKMLPPDIQSLVGMRVRLYGAKGACETKIKGFRLVSKEVPHFGEIQRWKDEKTPAAKIAAEVFESGYHHLVATTEKCVGDFAKDARLSRSPVVQGRKADNETKNKVRRAFRALPIYKKVMREYEKVDYQDDIQIFTLNLNGKPSTWISIFATAGEQQCGSFPGELGALWKVVDGTKELRLKWVRYLDEDVEYATDIENDGIPEFYHKGNFGCTSGFYEGGADDNKDRLIEETIFRDCPC